MKSRSLINLSNIRIVVYLIALIIILIGCDQQKTKIYEKNSWELLRTDSLLDYEQLLQNESLVRNNKDLSDKSQFTHYLLYGDFFESIGSYDSALVKYQKAITFITDSVTQPVENRVYISTFNIYKEQGNTGNAIATAIELQSKLKKDDLDNQNKAFILLEGIYGPQRKNELFLLYNKKRINNYQKQGQDSLIFDALVNRFSIYSNSLKAPRGLQLSDSLSKFKQDFKPDVLRKYHSYTGIINHYLGNLDEAITNYKKAIEISDLHFKKEDDYNSITLPDLNNIAEAYMDLEQYNISKKYLNLIDSDRLSNVVERNKIYHYKLKLRWAIETKTDYKSAMRDYENANHSSDNKKAEKDLIALKVTKNNLIQQKEKYFEAERKRKNSRNIAYITSVIAISILLISFLFFKNRKKKVTIEKMEMERRLLRSQMNPHFIFNSINSIYGLIDSDRKLAKKYLLIFSRLMRVVFENSDKTMVSLSSEIDLIEKYIDLQLLRFPDRFNYKLTLENIKNLELLSIPSMIIQPFIENSIQHGFKGIEFKGNIEIHLKKKINKKKIQCTIIDNGIGYTKKDLNKQKTSSILLISKYLRKNGCGNIKIIAQKNITKTIFNIPLKTSNHD